VAISVAEQRAIVRGCWKFEKAGKIGMHSSWRVTKEIGILPIVDTTSAVPNGRLTPTAEVAHTNTRIPTPESTKLELDLSSPWAENS
jgi:hypothetical protein